MTSASSPIDATPPPAPSRAGRADDYMPVYVFARFFVRLHLSFWHRMRVTGLENLPGHGGVVLAANHLSHLDPPLLGSACPRPVHFLAKEELFHKPLLKWFLPQIAQLPVGRDPKTGGSGALLGATNFLKEGKVIGVYPEGTRSRTGDRQAAKSGVVVMAATSGAPIVPVHLYGTRAAMPPGSKVPIPFKPIGAAFGPPIWIAEGEIDLHDREAVRARAEAVLDVIYSLPTPERQRKVDG